MIDQVLDEIISNILQLRTDVGELEQREQPGLFTATRTVAVAGSESLEETDGTLFCDVTAGSITVRLPSAINRGGRVYIVKHVGGSLGGGTTLTVATTLGQTIDGVATASITAANGVLRLQSDGANWWLI